MAADERRGIWRALLHLLACLLACLLHTVLCTCRGILCLIVAVLCTCRKYLPGVYTVRTYVCTHVPRYCLTLSSFRAAMMLILYAWQKCALVRFYIHKKHFSSRRCILYSLISRGGVFECIYWGARKFYHVLVLLGSGGPFAFCQSVNWRTRVPFHSQRLAARVLCASVPPRGAIERMDIFSIGPVQEYLLLYSWARVNLTTSLLTCAIGNGTRRWVFSGLVASLSNLSGQSCDRSSVISPKCRNGPDKGERGVGKPRWLLSWFSRKWSCKWYW